MRLQKMLLKLQPYTFKLVSKSGKDIPVADALSRLPIKDTEFTEIGEDLQSFNVCAFEITSINAFSDPKLEQLKQATKDDHELQMLSTQILEGWPDDRNSVPSLLKTYYDFRDELAVYDGIVFKGERVIIPKVMQTEILNLVHYSHQGIVKSKQLARDIVYWKSMNAQIEDLISRCAICQTHRNNQQKEPMMSTEVPTLPWQIVSADLFQFNDDHYIAVVQGDPFSNVSL